MTADEWERNIAHLEGIVREMRAGTWRPSREMILLTRDAETGIVTFARIGRPTGVLRDAYAMYENWEENGAQVQ